MICSLADAIQRALDEAGPDLTEEAFIAAMESLDDVRLNSDQLGSFGPDKHDASDTVNVLQWELDCTCWQPTDNEYVPIED